MTASDEPSIATQTAGGLAAPLRIAAIIPVGTLESAKSRLGDTLDAEERLDLTERLLARTVATALAVGRLADVLVISPDPEVLRRAADHGARTLRQRTLGLNAGLAEARADVVAGGAGAILVLPIDLALVSVEAVDGVLDPVIRASSAPTVVLVTDRQGVGTNALALRPPGIIDFAFGPGSRRVHRSLAEAVGATYAEVESPLAFDIDTPADLLAAESTSVEGIRAS